MNRRVTRRGLTLDAAAGVLRAQSSAPGIGVIGLGNRAQAHLRALASVAEARIVGLSDVESAKIDAVNAKLPSKAASYTDYRELLRDRNVAMVVIVTPNHLHHEMAIAALRAGKDVLLEKPIALHHAQALEIQREAARTGRILAVGMQRAFRSDVELVNSPLARLTSTGGALRYTGRDIRDCSTTIVEFTNGVRLSHTYCMFAPQAPFVVVLGDGGSLRRDANKLSLFDPEGKPKPLAPIEQPAESDDVLMYRDFFESVRLRRPPRVGAGLAIEASRIAWGIEISITENRTVTARDFA